MPNQNDPSIGEVADAAKTTAEAIETGGASLAADPMATARLAGEAPKIVGKGIRVWGTCCSLEIAAAVFVGLFIIALFNPSSAPAGTISSDTNNGITSSGGTGGGDLANADALTLPQIESLLNSEGTRGKRMLPYAQQIYNAAHTFHINPLLAIAMSIHDSSLASAGAGKTCRNPGNISHIANDYINSGIKGLGNCSDVYGGSSRWGAFSTIGDGMQAQIWLLRTNYLDKGYDTLAEIIHRYAPSSDGNNEGAYVSAVQNYMSKHAGGN